MTSLVATFREFSTIRFDRTWLAIAAILFLIAWIEPAQLLPTIGFALSALLHTAPFILMAVAMIGYLKASGAEHVIAKAFIGRETRMVIWAALLGGLAPFCSCEVIPFIAGLLAVGTPLAPVMAFWLASPLIDPPSLFITAGELGWDFAIAKTMAAIGIGLLGGFTVMTLARSALFASPLRNEAPSDCVADCSTAPAMPTMPHWQVWQQPTRRAVFFKESMQNLLFLAKWLTFAYVLESLMVHYLPAEQIAAVVGGDGLGAILIGALVGAPAYLNGYAAPALVSALMDQGMSAGAAMAFMTAGAATCIPAMTAVFALVKSRVFAAYVVLAILGAVLSGIAFSFITAFVIY